MEFISNYHSKHAIKDDCIGFIQYWRFKKLYLFFNTEKGIVDEVTDLSCIKLVSHEQYKKLYSERNVRQGGVDLFEENYLKIREYMTTHKTGKWSENFCVCVSTLKANTEIYKEQTIKGLSTIGITGEPAFNREVFFKHELNDKGTQMITCEKMFEEEMSDEEVEAIIKEWKTLPAVWQQYRIPCEELDALLK